MCNQAHIDYFNDQFLSWKFNSCNKTLLDNISANGILTPILTIAINNQYVIVDGRQRLLAAKSLGLKSVPYSVIDPDLTTSDLIKLLHSSDLDKSTIYKLRYLRHFNIPLDKTQLSKLGLPYYSHIKKDVDRILELSDDAQRFLHDKSFSLKEMVNLLHYSSNAFDRLLADDPYFHFTKRTFDESLSIITALIKRHSFGLNDLLTQTNYLKLIDQSLTPQQRQKKWLDDIRLMASPVLRQTQQNIDSIIAEMALPAVVTYDRTLENTGVSIQAKFTSIDDINQFVTSLSDDSVQHQIKQVMDLT